MTSGFSVDPAALAAAAAALRIRADRLGAEGTDLPPPDDADFGRAHPGHSAAVAEALRHVQDAVRRCALDVRAFADRLDAVGGEYGQAESDAVAGLARVARAGSS